MNTFRLIALLFSLAVAGTAFAETRYDIRVDGLACPFCAYGIEKTFKKMEGVQNVNVDLEAGKVYLLTSDDIQFTEAQLKDILADAGFTYRGMERHQRGINGSSK